jgi:hypothetical protein
LKCAVVYVSASSFLDIANGHTHIQRIQSRDSWP